MLQNSGPLPSLRVEGPRQARPQQARMRAEAHPASFPSAPKKEIQGPEVNTSPVNRRSVEPSPLPQPAVRTRAPAPTPTVRSQFGVRPTGLSQTPQPTPIVLGKSPGPSRSGAAPLHSPLEPRTIIQQAEAPETTRNAPDANPRLPKQENLPLPSPAVTSRQMCEPNAQLHFPMNEPRSTRSKSFRPPFPPDFLPHIAATRRAFTRAPNFDMQPYHSQSSQKQAPKLASKKTSSTFTPDLGVGKLQKIAKYRPEAPLKSLLFSSFPAPSPALFPRGPQTKTRE